MCVIQQLLWQLLYVKCHSGDMVKLYGISLVMEASLQNKTGHRMPKKFQNLSQKMLIFFAVESCGLNDDAYITQMAAEPGWG